MWRCRRDPAHTRQRRNGNGCLDCHIDGNHRRIAERASRQPRASTAERAARALFADPFDDVVITPAARSYLAAFDRYLVARRDGLVGQQAQFRAAMVAALQQIARG